jgi:hypothetical protein
MRKLATVLGCEVEDLSPVQGTQAEADGRAQELSMTMIGGRQDMALLTVNKVLPVAVAIQILSLITQATMAEEKSSGRKPSPV